MIFYAVTKFAAYCLWCWLGVRLLTAVPATAGSAIKLGAIRWMLGLAFGVAAGIAIGSIPVESVASLYFATYIPLRLVEWSIMAALVGGAPRGVPTSVTTWWWLLGGVAVSFASDLASPEGMAGRFCVGRCLC
jgi:hypothetical protein